MMFETSARGIKLGPLIPSSTRLSLAPRCSWARKGALQRGSLIEPTGSLSRARGPVFRERTDAKGLLKGHRKAAVEVSER